MGIGLNTREAPICAGGMIATLAQAEGSAAHSYVNGVELRSGRHATRNLADTVHYLCLLHGRYPGVVDYAANHTVQGEAREWLISAVDGFVRERSLLTKLTVAAGPLPSTPGQAESEAAAHGQRHALEMLAQSDRTGCALGAAIALVLDWSAVRGVLGVAAKRLGLEAPDAVLPDLESTSALAQLAASASPAVERAMTFGAQQILAQHRGLWDLLEARQIARGEY